MTPWCKALLANYCIGPEWTICPAGLCALQSHLCANATKDV